MVRITKTVKIVTATMVAGYDICTESALQGLSKAQIIYRMGWVGSDAAHDTQLQLQDGQSTPISLHNMDTVANGLKFNEHILRVDYVPRTKDIKITPDVNLGAGDCLIFVDAEVPST